MKQTGNKIVAYFLAGLVFVLVFVLTFYLGIIISVETRLSPPLLSDSGTTVWALLTISIPILIGWFVARSFSNWYNRKKGITLRWIPRNKIVVRIIIGLYLITACSGIPSIISHNSYFPCESKMKSSTERSFDYHNYLSIPVLPGVVLCYHDVYIGPSASWGEWDFQLWYVTGSVSLFHFPFYLS